MSVTEEIAAFGVVDAPEDEELHAIARLAAHICGVPSAMVNLLTDQAQHTVAAQHFPLASVPREDAMCATTLRIGSSVHVTDATMDPRFADNPFVTGRLGTIRFYAASLVRGADGTPVGTLCVSDVASHELDAGQRAALDDLAEQAAQVLHLRAESRRLTAANTELARSNADFAEFTGRVAHDLRNPLAGARGFLQLALGRLGDGLTGQARECVKHAEGATQRMATMIDDLLAYAGVGARARPEPVPLEELVTNLQTDLQALVESTGGRIEALHLPTVTTDRTLVCQLLQNFITNGLKFGRPDVPPVVTITGSTAADGWSLSVIDNGRGIPADERGQAFELFTRLPGGRDVTGSGIGLATCARIADSLGGSIEITDTPGGGTTFTLTVR